jgi:hypothetical protein
LESKGARKRREEERKRGRERERERKREREFLFMLLRGQTTAMEPEMRRFYSFIVHV